MTYTQFIEFSELRQMQKVGSTVTVPEFSLNDFHSIQRIETNSKSSTVTRIAPYLTIGTFLDVVVKNKFSLPYRTVSIQCGE